MSPLPSHRPRGFSIPELIVVLSITMVLAGLLFPVLSEARQRANRVLSANNLRTIGFAVTMYDADFRALPSSGMLEEGRSPSELTLLFRSELAHQMDEYGVEVSGWDGLGKLWQFGYVDAPKVYFAPHRLDVQGPEAVDTALWGSGERDIHGDYHYGGHIEWDTGKRRSLATEGLIIACDTIRLVTELNHEEGMNLVRSDGSVEWISFSPELLASLARPDETPAEVRERYLPLWRRLEGGDTP